MRLTNGKYQRLNYRSPVRKDQPNKWGILGSRGRLQDPNTALSNYSHHNETFDPQIISESPKFIGF